MIVNRMSCQFTVYMCTVLFNWMNNPQSILSTTTTTTATTTKHPQTRNNGVTADCFIA